MKSNLSSAYEIGNSLKKFPKIFDIITELSLWAIILLMPFSNAITLSSAMVILVVTVVFMVWLSKNKSAEVGIFIAVLIIIIFSLVQKTCQVEPLSMKYKISLSAIFLSFAILSFMLKILIEGGFTFNLLSFKLLLVSLLTISILMLLFYVILSRSYLLNFSDMYLPFIINIVPYVTLFIIIQNLTSKSLIRVVRLSGCIVLSLLLSFLALAEII